MAGAARHANAPHEDMIVVYASVLACRRGGWPRDVCVYCERVRRRTNRPRLDGGGEDSLASLVIRHS